MNFTQNEKINQVKESTIIIGNDIASEIPAPEHLIGKVLN